MISHRADLALGHKSAPSRRKRNEMRPYQEWAADRIVVDQTVFLAIDMSMGKTAIVLTAIRDLFKLGKIRHALIIAPLRVAESTWPDEIAAWAHTCHLTFEVATGLPGQRKRAINARAQVTMINRENMQWLWNMLQERRSPWIWDFCAWDESSGLKEWRKRTAGTKLEPKKRNLTRFGAMANARKFIKYMVLLTGTPAPSGLKNLGGQAYILDQGMRLGESKTAFLERWFDHNAYSHSYEPKDHAHDEIMGRLKDVMISLRAEDYLDLPPVKPNDIYVDLPPKVMAEYKKFERDMVSEVYDVEAITQGVLTNKLLQFANGAMYRGGEDLEENAPKTIVPVHDCKLDALDQIINEADGEPVLVGYSFKFDVMRIKKKYPQAVIMNDDKNAVENWNKGRIKILLTHPASAGHGLNLQYGGHIQAWYGLTWSLELFMQLNMRLPRPGQAHPCVFQHRIIARGTADEDVLRAMTRHAATQESVTNAVRVRLEGHRG